VFQASSSLLTDPSRPSQLGTSNEPGRSKSPPKVCRQLAPVAESESSDGVVICLDRSCSDDVHVNISSSSFRDEGHLNVFVAESEVGPRSSEVKVPQVEQEVVRGVGDPQSTPPIDTTDAKIAFKSTAGMVTHEQPTNQRSTLHCFDLLQICCKVHNKSNK